MPSRRHTLIAGIAALAAPLLGTRSTFAAAAEKAAPTTPLSAGLKSSKLIYLSPIQRNGKESRCQSEIWFTSDGRRIWVVTDKKTWRARALAKGRDHARVWVGDVGTWKATNGRYRTLPTIMVKGTRLTDHAALEAALARFGEKYSGEWLLWGPRFRSGFASGDRVLLQYDPV